MSLSFTNFGHFRLFTVETGRFRLDGGAMFGVVPKTLWSRHFESDEKNRIPMTARCLLIHSRETGRVYLIDTGIGHKFDDKFSRIYSLDFSGHTLESSLAEHGFSPADITDIVFTHMHFDHCGGAVKQDHDGGLELTFPEATHWVHETQWENVLAPNEREKSSFLADNIEPLKTSGLLKQVNDEHVYEPGFGLEVVHGHTSGQQLPLISDGQRKILFAADLIPTSAHLLLAWVMGFDTRPLETLREKERVLSRCLRDEILMYMEHDPYNEIIQLQGEARRTSVAWSGTLDDL